MLPRHPSILNHVGNRSTNTHYPLNPQNMAIKENDLQMFAKHSERRGILRSGIRQIGFTGKEGTGAQKPDVSAKARSGEPDSPPRPQTQKCTKGACAPPSSANEDEVRRDLGRI